MINKGKYALALEKAQIEEKLVVLIHLISGRLEQACVEKDAIYEYLSKASKYFDYALIIDLANHSKIEAVYLKQ